MALDDSHRQFLQFFLAKGLLDSKEVFSLFKKYEEDMSQVPAFITRINEKIKPMHLEIKKGVCEVTERSYYVLVNRVQNEATLSSSVYTPNELEYFKKLLNEIVTSDGSVSSLETLNLVDNTMKLSKNQAQELLARFVRENWITKSEGRYCLSVRSLVEMDLYIEAQYPDRKVCEICKKLVVKGQVCSECDGKIHLHCARRMMEGQEEKVCPDQRCRARWAHDIPPKAVVQTTQE